MAITDRTDSTEPGLAETKREGVQGRLKHKIMIVEDNKIARMVLQSEFAEMDAELLLASDGEEAMALAEKEQPDIITMQVDLPVLSGLETCRKLKNNYSTRSIPVIFVTQNDTAEERKEAFACGAVDYLATPFTRGKLSAKVQKLFEIKERSEPQTILVAEDSDTIRTIIVGILRKQGHTVVEARDGMDAWNKLQKHRNIDIIVSDINMPNMDGHQLCRLVRGSDEWAFVPILIVSTLADKGDIAMLLNSGADDYVIKPFATEEFLARLRAHIRVRQLYSELNVVNARLHSFNESLEKMVEYRTKELNVANMEAIMMLAVASEFRDTDTGNHVRRIADYTKALTLAMNYSETKAEEISYSSILHDVGKIAIKDAILKKEGKLTDDEFAAMKDHTVHGEAILSKNPFFKPAREVARWHHEKFDGTGYPDGLAEYGIPVSARITSVADVFDALTTKRVYKDAWSEEDAIEYILKFSGKHFDPMVVEAFEKLFKDGTIAAIRSKYK
ncbi:MAG: response regulator [Nitrospinae bacterium]|nr:response regulator [Nitrospinota bacterium]